MKTIYKNQVFQPLILLLTLSFILLQSTVSFAENKILSDILEANKPASGNARKARHEQLKTDILRLSDREVEEIALTLSDPDFQNPDLLIFLLLTRLESHPITQLTTERLVQGLVTQRKNYLPDSSIKDLTTLLIEQQNKSAFSDKIITLLLEALTHPPEVYQRSVIKILGSVSPPDARYHSIVQGLLSTLNNQDRLYLHDTIIDTFIAHRQITLQTAGAKNALMQAALYSSRLGIRLSTIELLISLDIDRESADLLSQSLAETLAPTINNLWSDSKGYATFSQWPDRAANALAKLSSPPYPDNILRAWLTFWKIYHAADALTLLEQAHQRSELSQNYIDELYIIAKSEYSPERRQRVYKALFSPRNADVDNLLKQYSHGDNLQRIEAGVGLQVLLEQNKFEPSTIQSVENLLFQDREFQEKHSEELRGTAYALLKMYSLTHQSKEDVLSNALRQYPNDRELQTILSEFSIQTRGLYKTILLYADDKTLPANFRAGLLRTFAKQSTPSQHTDELEQFFRKIIDTNEGYNNVQAAAHALKIMGKMPPLHATFQNTNFQSNVLVIAWLSMVALLLLGLPIGIIFATNLRQDSGKPAAIGIKLTAATFWIGLSAVFAVALLAGLLGSIGHNTAPGPDKVFHANIFAYACAFVYLLILVALFKGQKEIAQSKPQHEPTTQADELR